MNSIKTKTWVITGMILIASLSRLIVVIPNFTPVAAISLFAAAFFDRKIFAFIIPAVSIWISSLFIDNFLYQNDGAFIWISANFFFQVLGFSLIALMGLKTLKNVSVKTVGLSSVAASVVFFLITNFGSWIIDPGNSYSGDFSGLTASYIAGLAFIQNTFLGDLCYSTVLFGTYALIRQRSSALATA